jgi:hypothetical protein
MTLHSLRIAEAFARAGVLFRLRAKTGFPLTLPSSHFPPDRMNGSAFHDPERLSPPSGSRKFQEAARRHLQPT